jgi:type I site-specific restriction endonuclease
VREIGQEQRVGADHLLHYGDTIGQQHETDHKSEAETRASRIDIELSRAGWSSTRRNLVEEYVLRTAEPDAPNGREQFVEYVLLEAMASL